MMDLSKCPFPKDYVKECAEFIVKIVNKMKKEELIECVCHYLDIWYNDDFNINLAIVFYAHIIKMNTEVYNIHKYNLGCCIITPYSKKKKGCKICLNPYYTKDEETYLTHCSNECPKDLEIYSSCDTNDMNRCDCRNRKGFSAVVKTTDLMTKPLLHYTQPQLKSLMVVCLDWMDHYADDILLYKDVKYTNINFVQDIQDIQYIQDPARFIPGHPYFWNIGEQDPNAQFDLSLKKIEGTDISEYIKIS